MAEWKKVIVSGSDAVLNTVTASAFKGDGSALTGVAAGSLDIDNFSALGGANVAQGDNILISDGGTEKKVTFSNFEDSIFGNVSSDITIAAGGAATIAADAVTFAKMQNISSNNVILGNDDGADSAVQELTAANVRTIINVEDGADVTDATNVTAAGALMDSEVTSLALVKGLTAAQISGSFVQASASFSTRVTANDSKLTANTTNVTNAGALMDSEVTNLAFVKGLTGGISDGNVLTANDAVADNDFLRINGTEVEGLTAAQVRTAINVEDGADVTDATNVTAAGALMDSELSNLAAVKAIDQGLTTTSDVAFNDVTLAGDLVVNGTTTTLNTTNLNVEDQFILVNSGSTAKDAGIVFGGTSGTAQQGKAIIWDYSYNSNDGRLAVSTTDVAHNSTSNFGAGTNGYYVAGVFEGNSSDAATAKADHAGNIRIESSEIYIYV
tara:strand:+ start:1206 stop:2531 length:1326 start_codon:yes stop_codon:yes gene_type:complete